MGINDASAILLGARDPETEIIYFYREYYETGKILSEVAREFKKMIADIPQGVLHVPLIDPSADKRSKTTGRTYKQQLQAEHGIITKKANNGITDGIQRTRELLDSGMIVFFNSLKNTLREGCEYRYPTLEERSKNKNLGDVPLDKDNHLMDCLRYCCQDLPYNYQDRKRASLAKYINAFVTNKDTKSALSFGEMLGIIRDDNADMEFKEKNRKHTGGYTIC